MSENGHANGRRALGLEAINVPRLTDRVEVPGYDGYFRVQELTFDERISVAQAEGTEEAKKAGNKLLIPRLVALGWIDDDGNRIIDSPLVGGGEAVAKLPTRVVMAMHNRIGEMSVISKEASEELGKDSPTTPSASGGSPSA
jgi:hypothetical protein